jgi:ribosomal-protein-alanine N-acetyltransferase
MNWAAQKLTIPPPVPIAAGIAGLVMDNLAGAWSDKTLQEILHQPTSFGFFSTAQEQVVAFILGRYLADREAEILAMATMRGYQRRGIARQLLQTALIANAGRCVYLEVAADNPGAEALYAQCGFVAYDRRPQYYLRSPGPRVDAVLMRCWPEWE